MLLSRIFYAATSLSGYTLARLTGYAGLLHLPVAASVEPTSFCNLHCPECPSGKHELTRPAGFMSPELYRSVIDQLAPSVSWLTLYFQGEPMMHRNIFDMVSYARSRGLYVATSTNGHFLTPENARLCIESGLNHIIISLDGSNAETYSRYRIGGDFHAVTRGIKALAEARRESGRRNPRIILQCLVLGSNHSQLAEVKALGKELGADRTEFKSAQFYDLDPSNPLIPPEGRYSRYTLTPNGYRIKNKLGNGCFRMWSSCVITWDGKVVPCCYDKDAAHTLGDLSKQTLREIWHSEAYRRFRRQVLTARKSLDICRNCGQKF